MKSNVNKTDCLYYLGSKPCAFHKQYSAICIDCKYYKPIKRKVLVIKLGAMGDVLRTTAILPKIMKNDNTEVTWITDRKSVAFLQNKYINRVVDSKDDILLPMLMTEYFDEVYSLENSYEAAILAEISRSDSKKGYGVNKLGKIYAFNKPAQYWLNLANNDILKKANTVSYLENLFNICALTFDESKDKYIIPEEYINENTSSIEKLITGRSKIWGIVTGAGKRWKYKSLAVSKQIELIDILIKNKQQILLIGGQEEAETLNILEKRFGEKIINSGQDNNELGLIKVISLCDIVVTPDSLPMHIALALQKKTYAYVGPTSAIELSSFGLLEKIIPKLDCLCCYKTGCEVLLKCNERFSWEILIQNEGLSQ